MQKLFIHIGTHKTGSSAIQAALINTRGALRREGIVHIPTEEVPGILRFMELSALPDVTEIKSFLRMFFARHQDARAFVLSWEGLSGSFSCGYRNAGIVASALREAIEGLETKIIVYLRRQDTFIESFYTQSIHQGSGQTFEEFLAELDTQVFDWGRLVDSYAAVFGRENVIVRAYDKSCLPDGESLIKDFSAIIGTTALKGVPQGRETNQGYSRDAIEFARLCNPYFSREQLDIFRGILQISNVKQPFENYGFFSREQRERLMEGYRESCARVAREYLGEPSGRLFTEVVEDADCRDEYGGLSPIAAYVVLGRAMVGQVQYAESRLPYLVRLLGKIECRLRYLVSARIKDRFRPFFKRL